jgi:radical SAM protein with 4Fe4S-binding SPASM domain
MTIMPLPLADKAQRGAWVHDMPAELYIETTNRCNLRCKTCPQFFGMQEAFSDLTAERVERILGQFPGVRRVVLHGIGEPLLNRDLPRIIGLVKARGAHTLFNTNGLLLRWRAAEALVRAGLDEVRVSIDSASPETYRVVLGADGFGRIIDNLRALNAVKRRLASASPRVSLWITGMRANVLELPSLVRVAHEVGVKDVYLQRLVYSGRGLAVSEQALFGAAAEPELAAVREAEELAGALGVALRGSGEASAGASVAGDANQAAYRACRRPWTLTYVTANGNVLPCCIAPFTGAHYDGIVLGNIFEQSAEEIWNGPRYRRWRRAMLQGTPPEACARCGSAWSL